MARWPAGQEARRATAGRQQERSKLWRREERSHERSLARTACVCSHVVQEGCGPLPSDSGSHHEVMANVDGLPVEPDVIPKQMPNRSQ
jgi:hypothetical protein